ncbi:peptidoglycan D,D-transpeptidase FtsI family protein [Dermacoccus barathri]|jgi:cell division protein FtsI (penicillin-binding protein 3)|uniref:peptidoglycan D,D-transpeptidase FtsI family protein n=1 Tax=Dermacoccus barathri TaxID=322601 RepID=UPI001D0D16D5|nr:penicillin-binding protein 2 [Dermacoccus barathri]
MSRPAEARLRAVGHPRRRTRTMLAVFAIILSLFTWQLVKVQWIQADEIAQKATNNRLTTSKVPAARGEITDSAGTVLARSVERRDVAGDPVAAKSFRERSTNGKPKGIDGVSQELARILGGDAAEIRATFERADARDSRFVYLAKDISPAQWSQIRALDLPGITSEQVQKREYPQGTALAPLLGSVNAQDVPGGGIEQMLNTTLQGKAGLHQVERARNGSEIATGENLDRKPVAGRGAKLTIDSDLQWFAQNELAAQVKSSKAVSGEIVVADKAGNILVAASYPSFDNNDMSTAKSENLQNRAFTDTFEPGSTQKMVTAGAVLEEGIMTPKSHVEVPPSLKRAGRPFHDSHPHPTEYLTLAGVIAQSSNIGTILAGEKLPKEKLYTYMKKFGLGEATGIGFPGESTGIVPKVSTWKGDTWYTIMFGQGLASSAVQQVGLFQAIANGGVREPLKLVSEVQGGDGAMQPYTDERKSTRVFSAKTSKELVGMMQGVVTKDGSAPKAAVPGYDVAGKTSTAERYDSVKGGYDGVTAGFIGMAPAKDPQLIVSVTLQRPQAGTFGGDLAAPVFSKVMAEALRQRKIPPNKSDKLPFPIKYRSEESTSK